ncbi:hypothetical protein ZOSMA_5G02120 [Zostera marina]|uniref:Uncharacterized protein n=1 Tax=Zostera marina TaxID=29655 RepID=A0A0K9NWH7_ZOSMR|nr:hypothetical protein ZOSMA_5G02120 [Zostera marina]
MVSDSKTKKIASGSSTGFASSSGSKSTTSVSRSATMKGKSTLSAPTKTAVVKRKIQKKSYSLPGQKFDVPEEREPLRIFYETLSKQIPTSEMADFWLMEHGLLSPERAKKAYDRKQRKQRQIRAGIPIKSQKDPKSQRKHWL